MLQVIHQKRSLEDKEVDRVQHQEEKFQCQVLQQKEILC